MCEGGLLQCLHPARLPQSVQGGLAALGHGPGGTLPAEDGGGGDHAEPQVSDPITLIGHFHEK